MVLNLIYLKYLITLLCTISNLFFKKMSEPVDMVPLVSPTMVVIGYRGKCIFKKMQFQVGSLGSGLQF